MAAPTRDSIGRRTSTMRSRSAMKASTRSPARTFVEGFADARIHEDMATVAQPGSRAGGSWRGAPRTASDRCASRRWRGAQSHASGWHGSRRHRASHSHADPPSLTSPRSRRWFVGAGFAPTEPLMVGHELLAGRPVIPHSSASRCTCHSYTAGSQSLPNVADGPMRGSSGAWPSRKACTYARSSSIRART